MNLKIIWAIIPAFFIWLIITGLINYQEEHKPITLVQFNQIVSNQDTAVLVYCSATWCGVCRKMKPLIEEIESYNPKKLKVLHVDADRDRELYEEFELNSLPVLMLYKKAQQKWVWHGIIDKPQLKGKLDPHLW